MTAGQVLEAVARAGGPTLSLEGKCPGGEVGAYFARAANGERLVFKWVESPSWIDECAAVVARVDGLRARGYPAPAYRAPVAVDGAVVVFQDAVPGAWCDEVDEALVDTVLSLNELQADVSASGGTWSDFMARTLVEGAEGHCLHAPLLGYSAETRRILSWVQGVGRELRTLPSGDIVHGDFHHRNILRRVGAVTAVVDWEGCRNGDRVFDLVTFAFGFTHAVAREEVEDRIWKRASEMASAERLRPYVAHMALRRIDWSIRHHDAQDVDRVVAITRRYQALVQ